MLTALLLSAEPQRPLEVVCTAAPGQEQLVARTRQALGALPGAEVVDVSDYLKSLGADRVKDARCLLKAPGLEMASRLLRLRLMELQTSTLLGRGASSLEAGELAPRAREPGMECHPLRGSPTAAGEATAATPRPRAANPARSCPWPPR